MHKRKKKLPAKAPLLVHYQQTADEAVSFWVEDARRILTQAGVARSLIARFEAGEQASSGDVPQGSFDEKTGMIHGDDRPAYAAEYLRSVFEFRAAMKKNILEDVASWANAAGFLSPLLRAEKGLRNHWAGGRMQAEAKRLKREKEIDPLIREEWSKLSPEDRSHKASDALSAALEKRGQPRASRTCLDDIKRLKLRG